MSKLQIVGPKGSLDECIRLLHAMAVVHLETVPLHLARSEGVLRKLPLEREKAEEKEFLEKANERIKNLIFLLKAGPAVAGRKVEYEQIAGLIDAMGPVEEEVKELHAEKEELSEELSSISKYEKVLRGFAPIVSSLGGLNNFDILGLTIMKRREDIVGVIEESVGKITGGSFEIYVRPIDEATLGIILTYPRKYSADIRHLILGEGIHEIRLPGGYREMSLLDAIKGMVFRGSELPSHIASVERKLGVVSDKWYATVAALGKAVEDALDEIGVLTYCAQTRFCFVLEGWVPSDMTAAIKRQFSRRFGDRVIVGELEIRHEEEDLVPVYIKNPSWLRPFEVFLMAIPPPRYRSVDPTPYIALFFPVFFGLIVGDVGYGVIMFIGALYLRRRMGERQPFKDLSTIFAVCSVSAAIFGVLFGELFGDLGERLNIMHPILFNRMEAIETFMVLSLGVGVGHVLLGIVIGIVDRFHRGKRREAVGKISYLVLIVSALTVIGIGFEFLPEGLMTPGAAVLLISFVVFIYLERILGLVEISTAFVNILSYMRIMAVGTASVAMALVASEFGGLTGSLVVGIIVAVLIHTLNIMLAVLSPTLQAMRLQYVEFLSKFYEGGGRRYEPFRKR